MARVIVCTMIWLAHHSVRSWIHGRSRANDTTHLEIQRFAPGYGSLQRRQLVRKTMLNKELWDICRKLYNGVAKSSKIKVRDFEDPVDTTHYKTYLTVVKKPMDLNSVKRKLQMVHFSKCQYDSFEDFRDDMRLIFENCMLFNAAMKDLPGEHVYKNAKEFLVKFDESVERHQSMIDKQLSIVSRWSFREYPVCESMLGKLFGPSSTFTEFFGSYTKSILSSLPSYPEFIREPMSFEEVNEKLKAGKYSHFKEFDRDMILIGTNCLRFNWDPWDSSEYRDKAAEFLDAYEKAKKENASMLGALYRPKTRMLDCRRALDLILLRPSNTPMPNNSENKEYLVMPWLLVHLPSYDTRTKAIGDILSADSHNVVCVGDVSDKLYSQSYAHAHEFFADLKSLFTATSPPPYRNWSARNDNEIAKDALIMLDFLADLTKLVTLPTTTVGSVDLPIIPSDMSKKWPTEWYYEPQHPTLGSASMLKMVKEVSCNAQITKLFGAPVPSAILGYDNVIKDRMDLRTIEARLTSGIWYYMNTQITDDVIQVSRNCKEFNKGIKHFMGAAKNLESLWKLAFDAESNRLQKIIEDEKKEKARLAKAAKIEAAAKTAEMSGSLRKITTQTEVVLSKGLANESLRAQTASQPLARRKSLLVMNGPAGGSKRKAGVVDENEGVKKRSKRARPSISLGELLPGASSSGTAKEEAGTGTPFEPKPEVVALPEKTEVEQVPIIPAETFVDEGTTAVLRAVKIKNRKKEEKLSPDEESCKRLFNKIHNEVNGISDIQLTGIFSQVWEHNWSHGFLYHPLEIYPQERFKEIYLAVVQRPIALYFAMKRGNEAVYDKLRTGEYKRMVDEDPDGPSVKERFVADMEVVFKNAIAFNRGSEYWCKWIRMKSEHFLNFLKHMSMERLFLKDEKYREERYQLRAMRESFLAKQSLKSQNTFTDRTTEFIEKVMHKLKSNNGMKITYQHWNSSREQLAAIQVI